MSAPSSPFQSAKKSSTRPTSSLISSQRIDINEPIPFNISIASGFLQKTIPFTGDTNVSTIIQKIEQAFGLPVTPSHEIQIIQRGVARVLDGDVLASDITVRELNLTIAENASLIDTASVSPINSDRLQEASKDEITATDSRGRTILHYASAGDEPTIEFILRKKLIDVNTIDNNNATPLLFAARYGPARSLSLLRSSKADLTIADKQNRNFLHYLSQSIYFTEEHTEFLAWALENGLHPYEFDNFGNTAGHYAAIYGNVTAMEFFIDSLNYPIDMVDAKGNTCLHLAAKYSHPKLVDILLENGADIYVINNDGLLPVDYASDSNNANLHTILADAHSKQDSKAWDSVRSGNPEDVIKRLKRKEKQEIRKIKSKSKGLTRKSKKRRRKGMSSQQRLDCITLWAAARCNLPLLNELLDLPKINASYTTDFNLSLLNILCRCPVKDKVNDPLYVPVLEKLLAKGCNINTRPMNGNTCIHSAALNSNLPAVKFCIDHGAFLNRVNDLSMSEIHFATISNNEDIVKQLVAAGSDPKILLRSGKTCKEFAGLIGRPKIEALLESLDSKADDSSVFQPNVAAITIVKGYELLAKDDTGLSDPYVEFKHHCDNVVYVGKTRYLPQTLEPEWNQTFNLVIKHKNGVLYRDIEVTVYDWDEPDENGVQTDDLIGRDTIILDPRQPTQTCKLSLKDGNGFAGYIEVSIKFDQKKDISKLLKNNYIKYNAKDRVKELLKQAKAKSVGKAKAALGYTPKYPVMIVPGFASSALECWQAKKSAWVRERIWVDPFKIGHTVVGQSFINKFSGTDSKTGLNKNQRVWLNHLLTAEDGYSDPDGICVRAVTGLHATDFLADNPLAKGPSYVFGHLISELADVGYNANNLDATTYDWRIPPQKLEERDGYFTKLKYNIQFLCEHNKEKVVLMAHSMGNRCTQYFLSWANRNHPGWINENIHAFLALGPPFLGASKTLRAVISGDCCGLEAFLTLEEGRAMHRRLGSVPWLLPVDEEHFPDVVTRIAQRGKVKKNSVKEKLSRRSSGFIHTQSFDEYSTEGILDHNAPTTWKYYKDYYANDENYLGTKSDKDLPEVLLPPPVANLWVVIGTNLQTEVSYYYKETKGPGDEQRYTLDTSADSFSNKKIAGINPRGLKIAGGTGYETRQTYQPSANTNKSGDGTVPYCSLNYAESAWREYAKQHDLPINIQTFELDGVEHREMLNHGAVTNCILDLLCVKPLG